MKNITGISPKTEMIPLVLLLLSFATSFYFYSHFPERVPTHWGFNGEINGWSSAGFTAFFFPFLNLAIYLLFVFLPYFDPKRDRYVGFSDAYHFFKTAMILFLTVLYVVVGLNGIGFSIPVSQFAPIFVGALFVAIGYILPKLQNNWFFGIRTPWTISDDEIWQKTHLLGGKSFIVAGIVFAYFHAFSGFLGRSIFLAMIICLLILPVAYSYFLFEKKRGKVE